MSSDPIPVDRPGSQASPQRRSILYDIAQIVRRSQTAARRRSILYDITHIVLPVSFFLHFVITGTVVLIYSLYLHQPIPPRYSIGAAIAFGILSALILHAYLWLYCRRRQSQKKQQKLRDDIEHASATNRDIEKELENSPPAVNPLKNKNQRKRWTVAARDFFIEYETQHYRDILSSWVAPWQVKGQTINWNGVRDVVDTCFKSVSHILGREPTRQAALRHGNVVDIVAAASPKAQNSVVLESGSNTVLESGFRAVPSSPMNLGQIRQQYHADDLSNESSSHEGLSEPMEFYAPETLLIHRGMGSVATDLDVQILESAFTHGPRGLNLSPPHHETTYPLGTIWPTLATDTVGSRGSQVLDSDCVSHHAESQGIQRSPTPVPPPVARGNTFRQYRMNSRRRHDSTSYKPYRPKSQLHQISTFQEQQQTLPQDLRISTDFGHFPPSCRTSQISNMSVDISPNNNPHPLLSCRDHEVSPSEMIPPSRSAHPNHHRESDAVLVRNRVLYTGSKSPPRVAKKGSPIWDKTPVSIGPKTPPEGRPVSWIGRLAETASGRETLVSTLEGRSN